MKTRNLALLTALAVASAVLCGCTSAAVRVKPWERANLADDAMNPDRDPLGAGQINHVYFAREAANGGQGVGGSGCGCN